MEDRPKEVLDRLASIDAEKAALEKELNELKIKSISKLEADAKAETDARFKSRSKQFVTAKASRVVAETTTAVKNHIAKAIAEEAKEGRTILYYGVWGLCDTQLNSIIEELANLGYEVDLRGDEEELIIKW